MGIDKPEFPPAPHRCRPGSCSPVSGKVPPRQVIVPFSHGADLPAHLCQFTDQFVLDFGLISRHLSDSFICQKMALGLQRDRQRRFTIVGWHDGSAAFRQQFKAGTGLTEGLPAPHTGRPGCLLPASCAELHDRTSLIHFPAIGINLFIVGTGKTKSLGIHMAAAISPHIEFPAIHTQGMEHPSQSQQKVSGGTADKFLFHL